MENEVRVQRPPGGPPDGGPLRRKMKCVPRARQVAHPKGIIPLKIFALRAKNTVKYTYKNFRASHEKYSKIPLKSFALRANNTVKHPYIFALRAKNTVNIT